MSKTTNKFKIDPTLVKAIERSEQYSGDGEKRDYSITEILNPVRVALLNKRHKEEITEDVSDKIFKILGTLTHLLLERANDSDIIWTFMTRIKKFADLIRDAGTFNKETIQQEFTDFLFHEINLVKMFDAVINDDFVIEKRYKYTTKSGKIISGGVDWYDKRTKTVKDHKLTSVFTYLYRNRAGGKMGDWTKQLNMYRFIMEKAGYPVEKLAINAIFRDYSKSKAKFDSSYPNQVENIPIPVHGLEVVEAMIESKIDELIKYENVPDDELPICTQEERWQDKDMWAVRKKANKQATKVLYSRQAAIDFIDNEAKSKALKVDKEKYEHEYNKIKNEYVIEKRIGEPRKCLEYCQVREFCNFYKSLTK